MERGELAHQIFKHAHLTGTFRLRSGQVSNEYFDKYQFESTPLLLAQIAEHMASLLPEKVDYLGALEMGGIPIATAISLKTGIPIVFVRKEAKEYGTCKFAEGPPIKGKNICLIEDVITTGGQVLISTKDLRSEGAMIGTVLCVIDRSEGKNEKIREAGLEMRPLFTMAELKAAAN